MNHRIKSLVQLLVAAFWLAIANHADAVDYYLHPVLGNDDNSGTSSRTPFRNLARANQLALHSGDRVLLAAGQKFNGQLAYANLTGTATNPIVISSYLAQGDAVDGRAIIDAKGYTSGVGLKNCAQVEIQNLLITANAGGMKTGPTANKQMRCGVLIEADQPGRFEGFSISNLVVKDIFFEEPGFVRAPEEVKTANGTQNYGWGIRFLVSSPGTVIRDVRISDCQIENVEHTGLKLMAPSNGLENLDVQRVRITHSGGPGVQMSGVRGGRFSQLDVNYSGSADDTRKWGRGSGLWTWGSSDVVIEKSRFQNANGPGDSAGMHIDYNCRNVIMQYNLSANNAGGFCEILGNNYNCAYRYNVSINDGYRVKGKNGAFQEGKTFWLSGYVGKGDRMGPFNTYFYNNTIYVGSNIVAKIAVSPTAEGVLIANNIFCIKGRSQLVKGDQLRPDNGRVTALKNVVFENNLFLHPGNWPAAMPIKDRAPVLGDPEFLNAGGARLEDYVPRSTQLVKNRGLRISKLPNDPIGLIIGLDPEQDIFGHKIFGQPDLGAMEMP